MPVDGRDGVVCFLVSLFPTRPEACILFDDYLDRPEYQVGAEPLVPAALHGRTVDAMTLGGDPEHGSDPS